ncbi:hypothetical protein [Neptunicella sp. SCSIO 80796]|uniref:hypothetical protein n=1 Tax=Neptunicella plasticusilytica TaxID=3117012 RepID=UPI003A4E02A9
MNTVEVTYRVFMAFLIVFLLNSASLVHAKPENKTKLNLLVDRDYQPDFFSGSWLVSTETEKIEALIWSNEYGRIVGYLFSHKTGFLYEMLIEPQRLRGKHFFIFSRKEKFFPAHGSSSYKDIDRYFSGYIVDKNSFRLEAKDSQQIFFTDELGSNNDGQLVFSRVKVSDEFVLQLNGYQNLNSNFTHKLIAPLAIARSENPQFLVAKTVEKIVRENIHIRKSSPYDTIKTRPISEITLSQVKDNSQECKAFSRENGKVLFTRLASRKDKKRFYFAVEGEGVFFYYQGGGSSRVDMGESLASQDPKTAVFLCDNPTSINSNNSPSICPLCFYPAGRYLDQVYRGNMRADSSRYMSPHLQRKSDAHATVLNAIAGGKRLNLIEEMVGFYMLNYANSAQQCFKLGAFKVNKSVNMTGYKITDGLGSEVTRVDPYQVSDTYKLNQEFKEACSDICFKHGTLIVEAQSASLFERKDNLKKEKQAVLEVFSSLEKFMNDYDCNSDVRKKFEHNLIKQYNFYNSQ